MDSTKKGGVIYYKPLPLIYIDFYLCKVYMLYILVYNI